MKILKPHWPVTNNILALTTLKNYTQADFDLLIASNNKSELNTIFNLKQEHSINIVTANHAELTPVVADGSFTRKKNIICTVKTADCLPILITNKQENFVSAIHAGWRGLAKGIIDNFFIQTKSLNLIVKDLLFWFGPAIGPLKFEVGNDVLEKFKALDVTSYNPAFKPIANNKYLANIYQIAKIALYKHGITDKQIFLEEWCTYSQVDLFYSYRREPNNPNRMCSMIWINN